MLTLDFIAWNADRCVCSPTVAVASGSASDVHSDKIDKHGFHIQLADVLANEEKRAVAF